MKVLPSLSEPTTSTYRVPHLAHLDRSLSSDPDLRYGGVFPCPSFQTMLSDAQCLPVTLRFLPGAFRGPPELALLLLGHVCCHSRVPTLGSPDMVSPRPAHWFTPHFLLVLDPVSPPESPSLAIPSKLRARRTAALSVCSLTVGISLLGVGFPVRVWGPGGRGFVHSWLDVCAQGRKRPYVLVE